jgi:hypothetical protein
MRIVIALFLVALLFYGYQRIWHWEPRVYNSSVERGSGPAEHAGKEVDHALHAAGTVLENLGSKIKDQTAPIAAAPPTPTRH